MSGLRALLSRVWGPAPHAITSDQAWQATHRHKKGGLYRVIHHGVLEADRSAVVIYDDPDGTVWVRDHAEFYDGRFAPLDDTTVQTRARGPDPGPGRMERDVVWQD
ncbi:hypothetical protein C8N43_0980 [Litoreibacter ponti]|uniref:DUF1653 domain-containing protein n=1 Tax=Litoreibacter ponti TaxID=1510457 RepID=A0A2T6BJU2_9RHOB|nr:DUF1653 domain-containing protein [Litoreibacter ponti]PTX56325.1 hypothetical protein C8N43_0980 [Litoreibacter ponti]